MNGMLEITGCNLVELVKVAYDLSKPVGYGKLHFEPRGLTDEEAERIIKIHSAQDPGTPVKMDYVRGRSVKLEVTRDKDQRLWIDSNHWPDHTQADIQELLRRSRNQT